MSTAKKGRNSWRPASLLDVAEQEKGFRYRWIDNDSGNVQKKTREGWEIVQGRTKRVKHQHPETVQDGKPLDSLTSYRELILARMPEDMAKAREEYFRERTRANTQGLTKEPKEQAAAAGGEVRGNVILEKIE